MLCEGAFPLMETDEMNFQILRASLRPLSAVAEFIFTTLNGLYPLVRFKTLYGKPGAQGEERQLPEAVSIYSPCEERSILDFIDDDGRQQR